MYQNIKLTERISFRLISIMLGIFLLAVLIYSFYSYHTITATYNKFFDEKTVLTNRVITTQINPEHVVSYIEQLKNDKEFQSEQLKFLASRHELLRLRATSNADETRVAELEGVLRAFHKARERFKDEQYQKVLVTLQEMRQASGAKYVYVFANTGVPGMYTYIFDANDLGAESALDGDGVGTIAATEEFGAEATQMLVDGKGMQKSAPYFSELYGQLYYAYSPIKDEDGKTVAIVGTDMALEDMQANVRRLIALSILVFLVFVALTVFVVFYFFRRAIALPIASLHETASQISAGNVYAQIPPYLLKLNNELGLLANALHSMSTAYQDMIGSTRELFEAALEGRLDTRNDPSRFKGELSLVVEQINGTLDAIILYLDSMSEALFIVGPTGEINFANKQYAKLFGWLAAEDIFRMLLPEGQNLSATDLPGLVRGQMTDARYSGNLWVENKDGGKVCLSVTVCDASSPKQGVNNLLVIASDITDLMREKENAQKASIAKGEFLSRVSHELRTPMNVIIGMATLGLKSGNENAVDRFKSIDAASRQLLNIISDVLDMSRIEAGKMEVYSDRVNLCVLLQECSALFAPQIAEKQLSFNLNCDQTLPEIVIADNRHIRQIVINLLGNAVKFTPNGGKVTMSADVDRREETSLWVNFAVSDTGIGMSEEFLARIFKPFEQEDAYLQRRYSGTGLGLPICKSLIDILGGKMQVSSVKGQGSTFRFALPVILPEANETTPAATPGITDTTTPNLKGMHILIVDDIEINRLILSEMLEDTGATISEAVDGAEALEMFKESAPGSIHFIFMDVQMPRMNGYSATRAIRELERPDAQSVMIVAMTANAMRQDVEQAINSGMNQHMSKPVEMDVCLGILRSCWAELTAK